LKFHNAATLAGHNQMEIRMNTREICELNDTDLDVAAGGEMDCDTARIVSNIYRAASDLFGHVFHDQEKSAYWSGRADGVLAGGCGPNAPQQ